MTFKFSIKNWFIFFLMTLLVSGCDLRQRRTLDPNSSPHRDNVFDDEPEEDDSDPTPTTDLTEACNQVQAKYTPWKDMHVLKNVSELEPRYVKAHNVIRKIYGLDLLEWDDSIAEYAQQWADHLKATNSCEMIHRGNAGRKDGKDYGENLAWSWREGNPNYAFLRSPEWAIYAWSEECKDYNYETNSCRPGEKCGHFTQNVWKKTKRFGCGAALCDRALHKGKWGQGEVWVCNYDPGGNVRLVMPDGREIPLKPF